jgi:AraC family transcriptional regulator
MNDTYTHHIGRILKVLVYIEEHLDQELSLEKMAEIAAISPFYFHRLFLAYIGETANEYIKRLRLQKAEEKLRYSDESITQIATEVGYESPSAFTKVFNQVMGLSPREYRKIMQPLVEKMMKRTCAVNKEDPMLKPEILKRKEETVLFVRRTGDYDKIPFQAFDALLEFLHKEKNYKVKTFYSIPLDDPQIAGKNKCRFDACVALEGAVLAKGEVGKKSIPGGRFAVFIHRGPYKNLTSSFEKIFRIWYPNSQEELADTLPFCEHLDLENKSIQEANRITKIYIPIL